MSIYTPGSFKKAILKQEAPVEVKLLEEVKSIEEVKHKQKEEQKEEVKQKQKEPEKEIKLPEEIKRDKEVKQIPKEKNWRKEVKQVEVKPVEVSHNVSWGKNLRRTEEIMDKEVKVVKYLRRDRYLRRKKYEEFLENEYDNLMDIYTELINYDYRFLDKFRNEENSKGFYEMTRLVFNNLKRYE